MYILNDCNSAIYNIVLYPLKQIMNIIMIVAPILLIISLIIIFTKGLLNPDDKKVPKKIFNAVIALFLIFFISLIVNIVMKICGSKFDITECWNNLEKIVITNNYIEEIGAQEKTNRYNYR